MGGAAGTGGLTLAFVGVGSAQPDWKQLRADIAELLNDEKAKNPSVDEGVQGGGGYLAPMMLRLAWHCSGTWCKTAQNGGSDGGTMRFCPESQHGGNAGLGIARDLLEPIKAKHPNVSYADLYILAGVVAVEEMGGPKVGFRWGRTDADGPKDPKDDARFSPDGRLPDGDKHAQHLRDIFYRMGFDDRGIVALSGISLLRLSQQVLDRKTADKYLIIIIVEKIVKVCLHYISPFNLTNYLTNNSKIQSLRI